MIYREIDMTQFPICDTDIWVDAVLSKTEELLIKKYGKIIVCDVVEYEIMCFKSDPYFKKIATLYEDYKSKQKIIVIEHESIESMDRRLLERQLIDCDSSFLTGLADKQHEKHKGEIASAIYATYFEIPFLKSNDGAFKDGEMGRLAFPDLIVKNLEDMLKDLIDDPVKRKECRRMIRDNRAFMDEGQRIYKEEKNKPVTKDQVRALLDKFRM